MSAPLSGGTVLVERFRIVRLLGEGASSKVYEIIDEQTRQRAAIKILEIPSAGDAGVDRFLRDASAAGRADSAHIVATSDAGRLPSGEPYVVMELLDGITLTQRIAETGGLALPELAEVMSQACDGVQAAHEKGIVHASLSPTSVFITSGGGRPLVKILDFGTHCLDPARARPRYRAPEQVDRAASNDVLTDVYALGVILREAAAGARELPAALADVCARATAPDRNVRTPTARGLGQAIGALSPTTAIDPLGQTLPVSDQPAVGASLAAAIAAAEAARQEAARRPSAPPAPASIRPAPAAGARRIRLIAVIVAGALAALLVALAATRLRNGDPDPTPPAPTTPHR